jgi:hypothetical protein
LGVQKISLTSGHEVDYVQEIGKIQLLDVNHGAVPMNRQELRDELDGFVDAVLSEEGIRTEEKPPGIIYHYTTAKGLMGIIKSKHIWASHANYLNDTSERKYGETLAGDILQEKFMPLAPGHSDKWYKNEEGSMTAAPEFSSKYALLFDAYSAITLYPKNDVYVTSFCLKDNLLSQWRAYGNQGGYNIGFFVKSGVCKTEKGEFGTFRIVYDPAIQRRILDKFVTRILDSLSRHLDTILAEDWRDFQSKSYEDHKSALIAGLLKIALRFKDPSFDVEHEWRFYTTNTPDDVEHIEFREQNGMIVPYVALPLQEDWITFQSIRCGPTPHPDLAQRSVEMILKKNQIDIGDEIYSSGIPLRN